MKTLHIELETQAGRCRSCRAIIVWATVVGSGKRIPLNPPVIFTKTLDLFERPVRVVDLAETTAHFATCPQARRWRR